ncbi:MAG: hypothetical protein ACR2MD_00240 [Aridibacter sp.]
MTTGEKERISKVTTNGVSTEDYLYDDASRRADGINLQHGEQSNYNERLLI